MSIEVICITLIQQLFLNEGYILDSIRSEYNLEKKSISIRYFKEPHPHVMLHITPPNTNYKLSANFKIDEGRIIFNIKHKDEETGLLYEYKIDNGIIKHVYKLEDSIAPRIHNSSVFSSVFVKFSNPYYTVNKLLSLAPNSSDKPKIITTKSKLEEVRTTLNYVLNLKFLESKLIELRLEKDDIRIANEVFKDASSKQKFDSKLRLKFAYYTRFMIHNLKAKFPEELHEIPQTKENYVTNNYYTNNLATRYGDYYEDIRSVFNKKFMISQKGHKNIIIEEYADTLNFRFQKPFTTTDIFLHFFGKWQSALQKYNLTTIDNIKKLFDYVELTKSLMFTFVSLFMKVPKTNGAHTVNLNLQILPIYPCLSWTKSIDIDIILEINITIHIKISQKTGKTTINVCNCETKCNRLVCMDVIEIPYKNELIPLYKKKRHLSQYPNYKNKIVPVYKSLLDNRNIPFDVYKNSIEGAILSNNMNERFIKSLRKRYYEMDDFTNEDETVLVSEEYKELTKEEFDIAFPLLGDNDPDADIDEIIPNENIELNDLEEDEDNEDDSSPSAILYSSITKKTIELDQDEENVKIQSAYFELLIEKIKLEIEFNKLSKLKMSKSKEYNKKKLEIKKLKEAIKNITRDLYDIKNIDYDEEFDPESNQKHYKELEKKEYELSVKLYEQGPIYNKLSREYYDLDFKIKKNTMMFLSLDYRIAEMIKINPRLKYITNDTIRKLQEEEYKTRKIIEYIEPIQETIDEDVQKGKQVLDELENIDIDIGYGSSMKRTNQKIMEGLSDIAKGLIAVKNKSMRNEIELPLKDKYKDEAVDAEIKKLQLKQQQALKRIEEERREQIKHFAREDKIFKAGLKQVEAEFAKERELEEVQQRIETRAIIEKMREKLKLEDDYKKKPLDILKERLEEIRELKQSNPEKLQILLEEENSINEMILKTQENDEIMLEREIIRKGMIAGELLRLEEEEAVLKTQIEEEKLKRSLSWETKIRELQQYIESQKAKVEKIPTIHKNRFAIYKLTQLINNAQRLLNNEKALRSYNEKIIKLNMDYQIAKEHKRKTEELLDSPNKQLRRSAFNAIKNEKIIQESIEQIEIKMATIKKFIKAQRKRHSTVDAINALPDVDEALLKHKRELKALLKLTKDKVQADFLEQ